MLVISSPKGVEWGHGTVHVMLSIKIYVPWDQVSSGLISRQVCLDPAGTLCAAGQHKVSTFVFVIGGKH